MSNETAIALQVLDLLKGTNIGDLTNQILLAFGGIASVTIIYFLLMIYYQVQVNKKLKEQRADIDLLILLVHSQKKKLDDLHKVLILEEIKDSGGKQKVKRDNSLDSANINYNFDNDGFFPVRGKDGH